MDYQTIRLKEYVEIANTGDLSRLQISGNIDLNICAEKWESIVSENSRANGSNDYSIYLDKTKAHAAIVCEHMLIKAMLIRISIEYNPEIARELTKRGYKISPDDKYESSLIDAIRRSDNLITKAKVKENEIKSFNSKTQDRQSFEEIMANLTFAIKMNLSDDITLARYNSLKKLAKKQHEANNKNTWRR